jgi:hypothetical protein
MWPAEEPTYKNLRASSRGRTCAEDIYNDRARAGLYACIVSSAEYQGMPPQVVQENPGADGRRRAR